jgi:hypothetical protein
MFTSLYKLVRKDCPNFELALLRLTPKFYPSRPTPAKPVELRTGQSISDYLMASLF